MKYLSYIKFDLWMWYKTSSLLTCLRYGDVSYQQLKNAVKEDIRWWKQTSSFIKSNRVPF